MCNTTSWWKRSAVQKKPDGEFDYNQFIKDNIEEQADNGISEIQLKNGTRQEMRKWLSDHYTTDQIRELYLAKRDDLIQKKLRVVEILTQKIDLSHEIADLQLRCSFFEDKMQHLQVDLLEAKGLKHSPYENEDLFSFLKRMQFADKVITNIVLQMQKEISGRRLLASDLERWKGIQSSQLPGGVKKELLDLIQSMKQENIQENGQWDPGRIDSKYTNEYFL